MNSRQKRATRVLAEKLLERDRTEEDFYISEYFAKMPKKFGGDSTKKEDYLKKYLKDLGAGNEKQD